MINQETAHRCPQCGTQIASDLLSCPACQRLVHADTLKQLAAEAAEATQANDLPRALTTWRRALQLLPPDSRQYQTILAQATALSQQVEQGSPASTAPLAGNGHVSKRTGWPKWATALGPLGLLLWKFKVVLVFVLTKAKLLLLGLTKAGTLISMLLSLGVYWTAWGWKFALGLVVSIYIHEMGHVFMLQRYGIKATAPMFIPGFGAVVRLKQYPIDPREDARVGLAGPIWGLGAACAAYLVYRATGWASWAAIAQWGARINLFNLLPVWQLDGGRGFRALSQGQRGLVALTIAATWLLTGEPWLILLLLAAGLRALGNDGAAKPDLTTLWQFIVLIVMLSIISGVLTPGVVKP